MKGEQRASTSAEANTQTMPELRHYSTIDEAIAVKRIRDRLDHGLARAVTHVEGHHGKSQKHIDRHVESARDAASQMSSAFGDAMSSAITAAVKSFGGLQPGATMTDSAGLGARPS